MKLCTDVIKRSKNIYWKLKKVVTTHQKSNVQDMSKTIQMCTYKIKIVNIYHDIKVKTTDTQITIICRYLTTM